MVVKRMMDWVLSQSRDFILVFKHGVFIFHEDLIERKF